MTQAQIETLWKYVEGVERLAKDVGGRYGDLLADLGQNMRDLAATLEADVLVQEQEKK